MTTDYDSIFRPYLDRLAATGRKEITISTIRYRLISCLRTLEQNGRTTDPRELTADDFLFLKEKLIETRTTETTARSMLTNLDALVQIYGGAPILRPASILWNRPVRDRVFITAEDAARLYEAADPPMRLIIVLGSLMGLRREEIVGIRLGDINEDSITVHGKGHGKAGLVARQPMPAEVRRELASYLPWRAAHAPPGHDRLLLLLTPKRGRPVKPTKVLGEITDRIHELGASLGIRVTTHSLRRLFATTVYEITRDASVTQTLMRHASSITTFDCYIKPNERTKAEAVEKVGSFIKF